MIKWDRKYFLYIGGVLTLLLAFLRVQYIIGIAMDRGWLSGYTWLNYLGIMSDGILMGLPILILFSFAYFGFYYLFGSIIIGYIGLVIWQLSGGYDINGLVGVMVLFISGAFGIGLEIFAVILRLFLPMLFPNKFKDPF